MKAPTVHIVCFDVPYPVSHGGFFDLFYKIKMLAETGVSVILHCFEYGKGQQPELNKYCTEVFYYKRKTGLKGLSFRLPYSVSSRKNEELIRNLSKDNYPVLLEGTHCTYMLFKKLFPDRTVVYRLHNIEHLYYRGLAAAETSLFKKLFFRRESKLLERYEKKVAPVASAVLTVSENDATFFRKYCPEAATHYLPVFLPFGKIESREGKGDFLLYHGNLSVAENQKAVEWLLKNLPDTPLPLFIAGRNPSADLQRLIKKHRNTKLIANPPDDEMQRLIREAHIHLIFSFNSTGVKLKLLHALFQGRHCIANKAAAGNEASRECCRIADNPEVWQNAIEELTQKAFTAEEITRREKILLPHFDNRANAQQLMQYLR